ncbi:MAG: hypothetical protein K2H61_01365, partial [Muribaculaceae bacterium]|nr:hypothetical protein [Muribaculaceae bacterium]
LFRQKTFRQLYVRVLFHCSFVFSAKVRIYINNTAFLLYAGTWSIFPAKLTIQRVFQNANFEAPLKVCSCQSIVSSGEIFSRLKKVLTECNFFLSFATNSSES